MFYPYIKKNEEVCEKKSGIEIAKELFCYADGGEMSSKKDGLVNIGGLSYTRNEELFPMINKLACIN